MEQRQRIEGGMHEEHDDRSRPLAWADYDQLPEGGQWLYVVDKAAWDQGEIRGAWVPADLDAHKVAMVVSSFTLRNLARSDLVVVDQVGIEDMVDEDHLVAQRQVR